MPYGRSLIGGPTMIPAPGNAPMSSSSSSSSGGGKANSLGTIIMLLIIGGLYLVWALVERHERVQNAIQPKALALNARNLVAILLPVVFGIPLLKIGAAKYKALGGPGGDTIVAYLGAL